MKFLNWRKIFGVISGARRRTGVKPAQDGTEKGADSPPLPTPVRNAKEVAEALRLDAEGAQLLASIAERELEIAKLELTITEQEAAKQKSLRHEEPVSEEEPEMPLVPVREALCWLPAHLGRDYAEGFLEGKCLRYDLRESLTNLSEQMEALGRLGQKTFWLDLNHDERTKLFKVERVCLVEGAGIYCLGPWTVAGLELRSSFTGVSPTLRYSRQFPPHPKIVELDKQVRAQTDKKNAQYRLPASFGVIGAVCVGTGVPTFPATIKTLPLGAPTDDALRLLTAFNSPRISWPPMPTTQTIDEPKDQI